MTSSKPRAVPAARRAKRDALRALHPARGAQLVRVVGARRRLAASRHGRAGAPRRGRARRRSPPSCTRSSCARRASRATRTATATAWSRSKASSRASPRRRRRRSARCVAARSASSSTRCSRRWRSALAATATALARQVRAQRARGAARAASPRVAERGARRAAAERAPHRPARPSRRPRRWSPTAPAEALAARGARLVADAAIARGGCRVESDIGLVDATHRRRAGAAPPRRSAATLPLAGRRADADRHAVHRRAHATTRDGDADDRRRTRARAAGAASWHRYLADLQAFAAEPLPLETQGLLVRVTGLVLEAAGIRVPVGSVCEVRQRRPGRRCSPRSSASRRPRLPDADRRRARPVQRRARRAAPGAGGADAARRARAIRGGAATTATLHLPVGDGLLGRVVDSHGQPIDRQGPLAHVHNEPLIAPADQRDGPRPGAHAARHRRARDQRACSPSAAASASACSPAPASARACCSA